MGSTFFGLALMALDTISIVFRGRRCRVGKSRMSARWQPRKGGLERLTQGATPRVFSMQLYFAHMNGTSIEKLSRDLKLPEDWWKKAWKPLVCV